MNAAQRAAEKAAEEFERLLDDCHSRVRAVGEITRVDPVSMGTLNYYCGKITALDEVIPVLRRIAAEGGQ